MTPLTGRATHVASIELAPGETPDLPDGLGSITFENESPAGAEGYEGSVKRFVSLSIHRDVAAPWVLAFAVPRDGPGLLAALFVPRRRIWVKLSLFWGTLSASSTQDSPVVRTRRSTAPSASSRNVMATPSRRHSMRGWPASRETPLRTRPPPPRGSRIYPCPEPPRSPSTRYRCSWSWTAIAIYALAFVAYAVDLARRSAQVAPTSKTLPLANASWSVARRGSPPSGSAIGRVRAQERAADEALTARPADRPRLLWARIGTALTVLAFLFHVAGDITRGMAAGRVPWSNMYEFALTGTMLVVAVYLVALQVRPAVPRLVHHRPVVLLLGGATLAFYVEIRR